MEINGVNVKNMTNDEINSFIKQLYQSKTQTSRGGGADHTKISIRTLSSSDAAFDKKGKCYKYLNIPLINNRSLSDGSKFIYFQKNTTDATELMEWYYSIGNYNGCINYGLDHRSEISKSQESSSVINIFIMNYDE